MAIFIRPKCISLGYFKQPLCRYAEITRRFKKLKRRFSKIITQINFLKRRLFYIMMVQCLTNGYFNAFFRLYFQVKFPFNPKKFCF